MNEIEKALDKVIVEMYRQIDNQKGNEAWTEPYNTAVQRCIAIAYKEYNSQALARMEAESK